MHISVRSEWDTHAVMEAVKSITPFYERMDVEENTIVIDFGAAAIDGRWFTAVQAIDGIGEIDPDDEEIISCHTGTD